jgi:hypothetical protein
LQTIQKILIAVSILNLFKTLQQYRRKSASRYWLGLSTFIWGSLLIVGGLTPEASTTIANWFGVGRGADFALYFSAIMLWFFVLKVIQKQQRTTEELTELVRSIAIKDAHLP